MGKKSSRKHLSLSGRLDYFAWINRLDIQQMVKFSQLFSEIEARPLKTHHLVFVGFISRAYCSIIDLVSDSGRWNKYVLCIYICIIYVVSIMIVMHIEKPFKFEGLVRINFVMNNIQHWLYLFTFIHIECSIVKITIVLWPNYIAWSL